MAVKEYRFSGVNQAGEPVRGTVFAPSRRAARRRLGQLSESHRFEPEELQQRHTFIYKIRHASGKVVRGEQKAYSADEVREALERMDLEVLRVERKLLDFGLRPPVTEVVMFVRLTANMLRRKLPFDEILNLLIADTGNNALRQMMRDLNNDLKAGVDAKTAFMKHQHVLGKFTAYMLGLAGNSGNMAEMFEATARYLERKDEFKRGIRSAMITPLATLLAALVASVWFVWSIVPELVGLFEGMNVDYPPLTTASLAFAAWMDQNYAWVILLHLAALGGAVAYFRTTRGRFVLDKYLIRVPLVGRLLHKLNLEVFCRVFGVLYSGSEDNQEVMKIAAEATGNSYIEHQIKTITVPMMMARGADLVHAMQASGVFLPMTIARFRSGSETGSLRESAEEMAVLYEKETTLKMQSSVETIKTGIAVVLGLIVGFLTILSAETALMTPNTSDIMFTRP